MHGHMAALERMAPICMPRARHLDRDTPHLSAHRDPRTFALTVQRQDAGVPLTWTPAGTPILYQTLTQSNRSVGAVNLHLPSSASVIITLTTNLAASTVSAYAGFAGFIDAE